MSDYDYKQMKDNLQIEIKTIRKSRFFAKKVKQIAKKDKKSWNKTSSRQKWADMKV